jgi:hypothetical protein
MKKLLLTLLIIPLLLTGSFSIKPAHAQAKTFIVIVSSYEFRFDAYYAHVALEKYYNVFDENSVQYLAEYPTAAIDPQNVDNASTKQNVRWAISQWLRRSSFDDTIFIYFSCHGGGAYADGTLEGGRIDLDGDEGSEHLSSSGGWFGVDECLWVNWKEQYWDDELKSDLQNLKYKQLIAMFHSCKTLNGTCFSGGFIDDLSATGRTIITSSDETSVSWEDLDGDMFGEFSAVFFDALYGYDTSMKSGVFTLGEKVNADANGDGFVSIKEAWQYAYTHDFARKAVRTNYGQLPDPLGEKGATIDENPWYDDDGDGLPTFVWGGNSYSKNVGISNEEYYYKDLAVVCSVHVVYYDEFGITKERCRRLVKQWT